jgi:hypothetical protein
MRTALILLVFVALGFSCKKSMNCEEPNLDCSSIRCIAHWYNFSFKLIDKTTGADLVFGANPRYTSNDIKLYSDVGRTIPLQLQIDHNSKTISTMTAKEEMYLEIKGIDVYKLTAEFISKDCCNSRVRTLWQDGQMVCSCCSDDISLSIK